MRQPISTSSPAQPDPKHEGSAFMTMPVHLSRETMPQIHHRLRLISYQSQPTDLRIPHRTTWNLAHTSHGSPMRHKSDRH